MRVSFEELDLEPLGPGPRNLLLGCRTFTELRDGSPGIPRSVLSGRLKQLEQYGIIERRQGPNGRGWLYEPAQAGRDLRAVCDAIGAWGATWVELGPQHLDPYYSLWAMARVLRSVELPEQRVNTRFEFPTMSADKRRFWLLVQSPSQRSASSTPATKRTWW